MTKLFFARQVEGKKPQPAGITISGLYMLRGTRMALKVPWGRKLELAVTLNRRLLEVPSKVEIEKDILALIVTVELFYFKFQKEISAKYAQRAELIPQSTNMSSEIL